MTSPAGQVGLSLGGKFFFGGLTAGTFGLGCWQIQRYFEKIRQMEERQTELAMEPTTDWQSPHSPYRPRLLEGFMLHTKEVLIGPRGAPPTASSGGTGGGGMAPSAQGFLVLTPLRLLDGNLVWINRGWVPKAMVPSGGSRRGGPSRPMTSDSNNQAISTWDRPEGNVKVTAIRTKTEEPKMIAVEHDYSKRPLQLFWMDKIALQAIAESQEETTLFTQIATEGQQRKGSDQYPRQPNLASIAEFKTTPPIHAGYAATWYGLSIAGVYMTRKLITRGRG